MIRQLANEFVKNIKIMFRNYTSLSLLIISPLVLILLIGYTFSSDEPRGLQIGIVSAEDIDISSLVANVTGYATISKYAGITECQVDMALQKVHICIALEGLQKPQQNEIPSGKVTYYYDNARKRVSIVLINKIQEYFGITAEQISIETAGAIFENIQNLVSFINERKEDITQIKNESMAIKADLQGRKEKLEQVRDDFLPSYYEIKRLQTEVHESSSELQNKSSRLLNEINITVTLLRDIENNSFVNTTLVSGLISSLESDLDTIGNLTASSVLDINETISEIDTTIGKIDNIKITLDEEIQRNDEYITKIDESIQKIDNVSVQLEDKLKALSSLNPDIAEKLVKPITYEYSMLVQGATNIQLSFPQLLVLIIMFIALLFANISTLMEIHDRAYLRNLIAPMSDLIYVFGILITSAVIVFFQILVLFAVAQTRLGVDILSVFWQTSVISILLIMLFILIGMLFAYIFKTVQSSILVTTFASLILFMMSNALAPIEVMPQIARLISSYNPIVIGEYLFTQAQLFDTPLSALSVKLVTLVSYIVVLIAALAIIAKIKNRSRS